MCSLVIGFFSRDYIKTENRLIKVSAMLQPKYMRTVFTYSTWFLAGRASILICASNCTECNQIDR